MKRPELKLSKPNLKLPNLGSKGASAPKTNLKPPKFAGDLYADLRDRRLLPLMALLLLAIVAAPILLAEKSGEESPAAVPVASPGGAQPSSASFAVVPAEPGLRSYRRRLAHREARNPFDQPISKPKTNSGEGGESSGEGGESSPVSEGGNVESGGSTSESVPTSGSQTTTSVVVQKQVIGYSIDARAGFVGHIQPQKEIEPTTQLPNAKNPVVVFMGLTKDKKRALFLMTSNVTAYYGKGRCALDKQACQLLELKLGKSATFAYGYGESRYKLTLQKIVPVVSTQKAAATVTTDKKGAANGGAGTGR